MAAPSPQKPWETAYQGISGQTPGVLTSVNPGIPHPHGNNVRNYSSTTTVSGSGGGDQQPPPLPTRPGQQVNRYSPYSPYGTGMGGMYSPYSSGLYGGYGGYSGMYGGGGLYGGPYSSAGVTDQSTFARAAEENSRQAFQSIESIVRAVGSVSMMLESTFNAVYSSFRAVLGVADHFSRLKLHFTQILSALALIRTLKWMWRRLLILLRLRPPGLPEDAWADAAGSASAADALPFDSDDSKKSSWPIIMFFAVAVGGPWLIWKLLKSVCDTDNKDKDWESGEGDHFVARAEYNFLSAQEGEVTFRAGQYLNVAPKELQPRVRGWLLASADGKKTGLVPANYVKVLGKRKGRANAASSTQALPSTSQLQQPVTSMQSPSQVNLDEYFENPSPESDRPATAQAGNTIAELLNTQAEDAELNVLATEMLK